MYAIRSYYVLAVLFAFARQFFDYTALFVVHEDVEISEFNNRVDPHEILVDIADLEHAARCEPREIPTG